MYITLNSIALYTRRKINKKNKNVNDNDLFEIIIIYIS